MPLVKAVTDRVREVLNDPDKLRWSDSALLMWLSDALDLLRAAAPRLFALRGTHTTALGALQTLTNTGATEITDVVGLPSCEKPPLDAYDPAWQAGAPGPAANWMLSGAGPRAFLLYPPSPVGVSLQVEYLASPAELTTLADPLPVPDDYVSALADYVIGMAEAKDASYTTSGRAQVFLSAFASKLGIKGQA